MYKDNLQLWRRELWIEHEGKPLMYGWCQYEAIKIQPADSIWKPLVKFGEFNGEKPKTST